MSHSDPSDAAVIGPVAVRAAPFRGLAGSAALWSLTPHWSMRCTRSGEPGAVSVTLQRAPSGATVLSVAVASRKKRMIHWPGDESPTFPPTIQKVPSGRGSRVAFVKRSPKNGEPGIGGVALPGIGTVVAAPPGTKRP